jgi:hypothetical protein
MALVQKKWFKAASAICWLIMLVSLAVVMNQPLVDVVVVVIPLLHEMGHAIPGVLLYKVPARLVILPFGLAVDFDEARYSQLAAEQAATILIGGVLVNTIIGLLLFALVINGNSEILVFLSLVITVLLAVSNIIPFKWVDGGLLTKAILWPIRGTSRVVFVSAWTVALLCGAAVCLTNGFTAGSMVFVFAAAGTVYYCMFAKRSSDEEPKMGALVALASLSVVLLYVNAYIGWWILHTSQVL